MYRAERVSAQLLSCNGFILDHWLWSRSRRLGLETYMYQRLVSVSSREKLSKSRSRLGLGHLRLVPKTSFLMGMQMAPYAV